MREGGKEDEKENRKGRSGRRGEINKGQGQEEMKGIYINESRRVGGTEKRKREGKTCDEAELLQACNCATESSPSSMFSRDSCCGAS